MYVVHQGRQDPKGRSLSTLLAALLVLLAACSGGGQKTAPTTTTTSEASTTSTTAPRRTASDADWVGQGPQPLSQLVGAGGHVVYLGVDDQHHLQLVGLDPATGKIAWQRPSSTALHIGGVEEHLASAGNIVYHVESTANGNPRVAFPAQAGGSFDVVAVDAQTGKDVWRKAFDNVTTPLEKCGEGLCVFAATADGHFDITRLDLAVGDVLSEGTAMFDPLVAEDGELAISAARDSNEVILTSGFGQRVVWSHQRVELFGASDVTPDEGWSGFHVGGIWIAWLGAPGAARGTTSGITDDGRQAWIRADISPCFPITNDPITAAVLCGRFDVTSQRLLIGTIEGIDPQTGAALWSLDAGDLDVHDLGASLVRFDATHFGFHLASGDVGLDTASGPTGPPTSADGWCEVFGEFIVVEGQRSYVAVSWSPCTLGVGPNHAPPKSVPEFAGPTVNGFGAWVEGGEVRAAKSS
ncbi:MAG: hypothetical protein QOI95_3728 [Acidimicrobiaceae bacterium]